MLYKFSSTFQKTRNTRIWKMGTLQNHTSKEQYLSHLFLFTTLSGYFTLKHFSHWKFIFCLSLEGVRVLLPGYLLAVSFQQMPITKLSNSGSQIISRNLSPLSSFVNVTRRKMHPNSYDCMIMLIWKFWSYFSFL